MPRTFDHLSSPGLWCSTISVFYYLLFHSTTHLQFLKRFHTAFWNSGSTTGFPSVLLRNVLSLHALNEQTLLSRNNLLFTQPPEVAAVMSLKTLATPGLEVGVGVLPVPYCLLPNSKSSSSNVMSLVFSNRDFNPLQSPTDPPPNSLTISALGSLPLLQHTW